MPPKLSLRQLWSIKNRYRFLLICIFLFILSSLFILDSILRIKTIEIEASTDRELIGIDEIRGQRILFTSENTIKQVLLTKNSYIQKLKVTKKYPDTLTLNVIYSSPYLNFKTSEGYYILGEKGKILEKAKNPISDLPIVQYYQKIASSSYIPGDILDISQMQPIIKIYRSSLDLGLKIDTIDIDGQNVIAFDVSNSDTNEKLKKVLFTTDRDLDQQIYEFKTIIKKLSLEGQSFRGLDLRFNRPIITF